MRRAAIATTLVALAFPATAQTDGTILDATLVLPTDRYDHAVLGDALEWGGLRLTVGDRSITTTLPENRVFEDVEARLADVTGDGAPEVIVVETDLAKGASLAIYGPEGKIAATAFIGQTNRWLAPAGIADFDGDGRIEIAYVDRPHLRKDLVFVRLEGDQLVETLRLPGLTNHRIGDRVISGGVRDCGAGPELIVASEDWSRLMLVRGGQVADMGPMPAVPFAVPPC